MFWKMNGQHKFSPDKISAGLFSPNKSGSASRKTAVSHIESVGFTVSEMERAIDFYTRILPFKKISETEISGTNIENLNGVSGAKIRVGRLQLGNEFIELSEYLTPSGRPVPATSRNNDRWFQHIAIVVSDIDKAFQMLRPNINYSSPAPQILPVYLKQVAGIKAFYFKDCDNHILELIEFPPDKISRKWRELSKNRTEIFLGIDHTAIVVEDTQKSLEFYRDTMKMKISGESENYGTEQEYLTGVCGARVKITSLQTSPEGIGVELLQYRSPTDGKPFPQNTQSNDLWHWQTSFGSKKLNDAAAIIERRNIDFISDGIVNLETESSAFKKGLLIRDPDGHAVRIVE